MNGRRLCPRIIIALVSLLFFAACGSTAPEATPTAEIPATPPSTPTHIPTSTPTLVPTPTPPTYPPQRGYHSLVYDSESGAVLLFGGGPNEGEFWDDGWSYKTSTNTWTPLSPKIQGNFATEYASKADRVVFYLSLDIVGRSYHKRGETYLYDLNNDKLEKVSPETTPYGYLGAQIAYDSESDRLILFGGIDFRTGTFFDETWSYDLNTNTWTDLKSIKRPSPRNFHSMAYIPSI